MYLCEIYLKSSIDGDIMEINEQETIILINRGNIKDGYFRFSTSLTADWNRLLKRVGGEDQLSEVRLTTQSGRVTSYTARVPAKFLSKRTWSIGRPRPSPRPPLNPHFQFKKKITSTEA